MIAKLIQHKAVSIPMAASALFVLGGLLWACVALGDIAEPLIIRWNSELGIIRTGSLWDIAGMGSFGVLMIGINTAIAITLEERDWFWGKLAAAATFAMSILIFIAFAGMIAVNS